MLIPSKADPNLKMCIAILFPPIKEKIFKLKNPILTEPTSLLFLSWEGIFQNGVFLYRKWKIDQIERGRLLHGSTLLPLQYTFVPISDLASDFSQRDHYKGQSKEWGLITTFLRAWTHLFWFGNQVLWSPWWDFLKKCLCNWFLLPTFPYSPSHLRDPV